MSDFDAFMRLREGAEVTVRAHSIVNFDGFLLSGVVTKVHRTATTPLIAIIVETQANATHPAKCTIAVFPPTRCLVSVSLGWASPEGEHSEGAHDGGPRCTLFAPTEDDLREGLHAPRIVGPRTRTVRVRKGDSSAAGGCGAQ